MRHVYLLKSAKDNGYYVGRTDNIQRRLQEHTDGQVESTRHRRPLSLLYIESYNNPILADEREQQLKRFGSAYMGLIKRLGLK